MECPIRHGPGEHGLKNSLTVGNGGVNTDTRVPVFFSLGLSKGGCCKAIINSLARVDPAISGEYNLSGEILIDGQVRRFTARYSTISLTGTILIEDYSC
jgi:hypothetical protein